MALGMRHALDPEAFADLYARTRGPLFSYAAALLLDRAAAEDLVQRTFAVAIDRREAFRPDLGTPEAWLYGIARNIALDERRRNGRRHAVEASFPSVEDGGPDARLEQADRARWVFDAIKTLEPSERELVALRFWADLSCAEIGALVHCSESNVGTRLHRAITKLREVCGDQI
jgi:RNA polymerase sigma-70 factor, ECF subfamily